MNIMSRTNFQVLSVKRFYKLLQSQEAHAFAKRSLSQFRTPLVFGARGRGKAVSRQETTIRTTTPIISKYCGSHNMSCSCFDLWKNQSFRAAFHTTSGKFHGEYEWQDPKTEEEVVNVQIVDKDGKVNSVRGKIGDNLLYLAKRFEVEMEGACEASLACTTCHVYVDHDFLEILPEATETEEDLLDQAPFLKENSRLGCQIILNKQLDGIQLTLPAATKNFYVDGHKPTPH